MVAKTTILNNPLQPFFTSEQGLAWQITHSHVVRLDSLSDHEGVKTICSGSPTEFSKTCFTKINLLENKEPSQQGSTT